MKLQLNERTLNAYINEAIRQELTENSMDELFGSRVRKQSRRMITGQGWGNQNAAKNRNDISQTDANEDCPQTLVGMISKLESILVASENLVGINGVNQNLAGGVEKRGWLGGFKMKQSLVNAINALTTIANRINAIERKTGMNKIMENTVIKENGNDLVGNAIAQVLAQKGAANRIKVLNTILDDAPNYKNAILNGLKQKGFDATKAAGSGGFKTALGKVGSAAATAGKWAVTPLKAGATGVAGALTTPLAIATAAFAIAQAASVAATKGRQRNIVRTYNCAAILAKRLGNIAKQLESSNQQNTASAPLEEINVRRGMKSFGSIEAGMQELSNIMRQIGGVSQGTAHNRIVEIPEGLDLNTREGVLAFQQWVNSIPIADANGNPLTEDGIFGRNTNYVYDRIAQMLQQQGQSQIREGVIKESKAVETALANLERVAGATGSGGNAYSSIGAMSGGAGASRLQNAQNIKNIIRTYPPVLNQYLNILSDAGANVGALQPLNVDTRPHRNYSVKELQAIDTRIKELLQIARTVEIPEGENGQKEGSVIINGTLPPKPSRRPQPAPQPEPEVPQTPDLGDVQIEEPEIEAPDTEIDLGNDELNIDKIGYSNPRGGGQGLRQYEVVDSYIENMRNIASMDDATKAARRRDVETYYQNGKKLLNQAAENGAMTYDEANERLKLLYSYYRQCKQTIRRTPMAQQQQPQQQLAESRTRKKLNEREFKKLVRQIVLESLTR